MRIIDTHTHFYDPTRPQGVAWPGSDSELYRPVYPEDWRAVAAPQGVQETVVVEASAWPEDNQWILDLAATSPCIIGFVGHLLPHHNDFAAQLRRFSQNSIFRGIRVSGHDFLDNWDNDEFRKGAKLLADGGLTLDVNGSLELLAPTAKLAAMIPSLRIVLNHVGGAGDAAQLTNEWRSGIAQLGQLNNVFCKVSGLLEQTEAATRESGSSPRDTAYYKPILDHCWECFGEDRLLYGSNWPVCEKGGSYGDQFNVVQNYFDAKGLQASEKYFGKNALAAYQP